MLNSKLFFISVFLIVFAIFGFGLIESAKAGDVQCSGFCQMYGYTSGTCTSTACPSAYCSGTTCNYCWKNPTNPYCTDVPGTTCRCIGAVTCNPCTAGTTCKNPSTVSGAACTPPPDTTFPSVNQTSPTSATVNVATIFSALVSDNVGVTSCSLFVGGVNQGSMSGSFPCTSCTASRSHTFTSTGSYGMYARCSDAAGNTANGTSVNVSVTAGVSAPTVRTDIATVGTTDVQNNRAVFKGAVTNDGGATITYVRFMWGASSGSYPNSSGDIYCYNCSTFEWTKTEMSPGTTYYYKAQAYNSSAGGWSDLNDPNNPEKRAVIFLSDGGLKQFTTQTACTGANPSVSLTPSSQSGGPGEQLTYTVIVTNNDSSGCGQSTFNLSHSCPSGWTCSRSVPSLNINPGSDGVTYFYVTSASSASPNTYTVSVTATNAAASSYNHIDYADYIVIANTAPQCGSIGASSTSGDIPLSVVFTGVGSDIDGSISNYQWDFNGDGIWDTTTSNNYSGYIYTSAGTYCAKLRVQDNDGDRSANTGNCPGGICTIQVTVSMSNQPPQVLDPTIDIPQYCTSFTGEMRIPFSWNYWDPEGQDGSRFEFIIDDDYDCEIDPLIVFPPYDVTIPNGVRQTKPVIVSANPEEDELSYNQSSYYWCVKVYDNLGADSGWVHGSGSPFGTPIHPYPYPEFVVDPLNPILYTKVDFIESSTCYNSDLSSYPCNDINKKNIYYYWDFDDGKSSTYRGNATTSYSVMGDKTIILNITDELNQICSSTATTSVSVPLPDWKETAPY